MSTTTTTTTTSTAPAEYFQSAQNASANNSAGESFLAKAKEDADDGDGNGAAIEIAEAERNGTITQAQAKQDLQNDSAIAKQNGGGSVDQGLQDSINSSGGNINAREAGGIVEHAMKGSEGQGQKTMEQLESSGVQVSFGNSISEGPAPGGTIGSAETE